MSFLTICERILMVKSADQSVGPSYDREVLSRKMSNTSADLFQPFVGQYFIDNFAAMGGEGWDGGTAIHK